MFAEYWDWFVSLEWSRLLPELLGKGLGFLLGFAASWFLLFRRRWKELQRFQQGDSDDLIFQLHVLHPLDGTPGAVPGEVALLFRNVGPKSTVHQVYDNPVARDLMRTIADATSLSSPVLRTEGTQGFEVLNDALSFFAGHAAFTPFAREPWLFAMTCEDRKLVRKKCIRCFLIRPADLARFLDWNWCSTHVRVERPWHWFRVVALHQIAKEWQAEQRAHAVEAAAGGGALQPTAMPLVDRQLRHDRIRTLSLGLMTAEIPATEPVRVDWASHTAQLAQVGLRLTDDVTPAGIAG